MSFTDAMYEAMREFYFRGTPYPGNVGVSEITASLEMQSVPEKEEGEEESDSDSSRADSEDNSENMDRTVNSPEDRVNCFPTRPSSALVITNESPPIWFKPLEVFEVSFADMTLSRQHTAAAGLVDDPEGRGIALRFPRFKHRRPDKSVEQATTSRQIAQLFAQQSKQGGASKMR